MLLEGPPTVKGNNHTPSEPAGLTRRQPLVSPKAQFSLSLRQDNGSGVPPLSQPPSTRRDRVSRHERSSDFCFALLKRSQGDPFIESHTQISAFLAFFNFFLYSGPRRSAEPSHARNGEECVWSHGWLVKGRIGGFIVSFMAGFVFLIFIMAQPHGQMLSK